MNSILIVGVDSVPGHAVFQRLAGKHSVTGLALEGPRSARMPSTDRVTKSKLKTSLAGTNTVVFCGGAARSSWDSDFGSFDSEKQWLDLCLDSVRQHGGRLVMISSDAVFDSPWVFHNDDSECWCREKTATELRRLEDRVLSVQNTTVVRTNVLGYDTAQSSFCGRLVRDMQRPGTQNVDASTFSTPIASGDFADALETLLKTVVTGVVNIGGAERATPFRVASMLAVYLGKDTDLLSPVTGSRSKERSLRCQRLRKETGATVPMLRETIESLQRPEALEKAAA